MNRLKTSFYLRNTKIVARELLGKTLVHIHKGQRLSGKIMEVEAYLGVKDKAAHTYNNRRTKRTETMYMAGGHAYVYFIYGMYGCINVVTQKKGTPEAVLIRALEPIDEIKSMMRNRKTIEVKNLCSGPGKLCQALKITTKDSGKSLNSKTLFIEDAKPISKSQIVSKPRIGVAYAENHAAWKIRFYIKNSPYISKP